MAETSYFSRLPEALSQPEKGHQYIPGRKLWTHMECVCVRERGREITERRMNMIVSTIASRSAGALGAAEAHRLRELGLVAGGWRKNWARGFEKNEERRGGEGSGAAMLWWVS